MLGCKLLSWTSKTKVTFGSPNFCPSMCNFVPCDWNMQRAYCLPHVNYENTSSNHRLESADLNALVELLFKMLGMGREDSNACLVCKGTRYLKDHFIESVTENWRYFRFSPS